MNPIKYFKHITKDPITTIAEASARKKEIMPLMYCSAGFMAIGLILQVAAKLDFMAVFSFVGLVGIVFCGFLLSIIKTAKKKFEALTCNNCHNLIEIKTSEDFAKYISFTIEKNVAIFNGYTGNRKPTNGIFSLVKFSGTSSAVLSVESICPHCGKVKHLKYHATPFKCHAEAKKVGALQFTAVSTSLETAVKSAINDYNDLNKRNNIPYTFHSSKNPNFENRFSLKEANIGNSHPDYMGARIDYHKDVEEMLEHYLVMNELNGTLSDPNMSSKKNKSDNSPIENPAVVEDAFTSENTPRMSETITEKSPIVTQEKNDEFNKDNSTQKNSKKTVAITIAICAVLTLGGIIYGLITANINQEKPDNEISTTVQSIHNQNEADISTDPIEKININEFVGYWHINKNTEKELAIHNGNKDSVNFSLWVHNGIEINNATAVLQDNVANFSLAFEGAVIKGILSFHKDSIIVHITQSAFADMPAGIMEFTEQHMTSWAYTENHENIENANSATETPNEFHQETPSHFNEVPYLFSSGDDFYGIYKNPSFASDYVYDLPTGTYTIVEEKYDEHNNLWGKLKSGVGWICIKDSSN